MAWPAGGYIAARVDWRMAFLVVGVMGAFTTFSTFSLDAVTLIERGDLGPAAGYVLGSVVLCVLGFWAGLALFRQVL